MNNLNKKVSYLVNNIWIRFDVSTLFLKDLGKYLLSKYENNNQNVRDINFLCEVIEFCNLYENNNKKFIIIKKSKREGLESISFKEENLILLNNN